MLKYVLTTVLLSGVLISRTLANPTFSAILGASKYLSDGKKKTSYEKI